MARARVKAKPKTAAKKKRSRKASSSRSRLTPAKEKRGLHGTEVLVDLSSPAVASLVAEVEAVKGQTIGAYREPLSGNSLLFAVLPIEAVQPTPFQRDLSPAHTKRLAEKIDESGAFLDPVIVVRGAGGKLWTPNGRHRLAAAKVLGLRSLTALISPDEALAFKILALNTEKAHNLKDRSLEVIRMARELAMRNARAREVDYQKELEAASLLTLGIAYEASGRFPGSAYNPFLRKVDRFSQKTLATSIRQREDWASRLAQIEVEVKRIIGELQRRGFKSPYLRNYVVARINPVRFHRAKKGQSEPLMAIGAALTRMAASARRFDLGSVSERELSLVAVSATE